MLWYGGPYLHGFVSQSIGNGWANVRAIAGASHFRFVAIHTDNHLYRWDLPAGGGVPTRTWEMGGWSNVRLLGPGGALDSFVSVRNPDNRMVRWARYSTAYSPSPLGFGWETTRILG